MRKVWAVYPTDIYRYHEKYNKGKILQNTCKETKSNYIYLFTDSHVYFLHLYLFVYVV